MVNRLVRSVLAVTLFAEIATAEDVTPPLDGVQLVTNADGSVVLVLPSSMPEFPDFCSLSQAQLVLPDLPLSVEHDLRILVHAMSQPYGGDEAIPVYEGSLGRLNLPANEPARAIDVTNLMRQVVAGADLYGFLVTVPEGSGNGFDGVDGPVLLAAFQQATLVVSYRRIPPPPAAQPSD